MTALMAVSFEDTYHELGWPESGTGSRTITYGRTSSLVFSKPIPSRLRPIYEELLKIASLESGWNSYNAKPISRVAIIVVLKLLVGVDWEGPLPTVAPGSEGGITLEWGDDNEGVEIEVAHNGAIRGLIDACGEATEFEVSSPEDPALGELLLWAEKLA